MLKTVREILSLLTPSNFEEQLARMKTLVIDSEDQLAEVTDLFFEKRTNGGKEEKKKRVTAAKQTPLPKEPPVQNAVIEPEIKQVSSRILTDSPEIDLQIKKEMPNPLPVVLDVKLPSRQPLVSGLLGIAGTAVAVPNSSVGVIPQIRYITGRMQGRLTQGNNIFFGRPLRPGIQNSPRRPMAGGTTNPIQLPNAPQALSDPCLDTFKPSPTTATDDGEVLLKSSSLKYSYRDDQWSPFNPEGKKTYDRNFILQLRNNPACQIKPECLSSLNFGEILPRLTKMNHPNREKVAVVESDNSSIYAKMCQALLTKEVESASNPAETTNFRKLLLIRCQKEFAKDKDVEARKKELERQLKDLVDFNKKKSLANMRFIGELFKLEILSLDSLHYSILRLLGRPEDETSLECLCVLLTAIGKQLETPAMQTPVEESASSSTTDRENMNLYFSILDAILLHCKMSSRIRFMIQDMIELRQNGWVAKKDGHKEREEQKKELNNPQFQGSVSSTEDLSRVDRFGEDLNDQRASCVSSPTQHGSDNAPFAKRSSLGDPSSGRCDNQDFRPIPKPNKSAFSPSKDGDCKPDSLRSPNSGFSSRLRNQQSSRENVMTRPIRRTAQPPTLSHEVPKDGLLGKSTVTEDEIERKSHALLSEYFANENIEDAVLDMKEGLHPSTVSRFINHCLLYVLEQNKKKRRAIGTLLKEMVKRKLFDSSDILEGFTELFQSAEDFIVDIPKLWEYVAELVEPLFEDDAIDLDFLTQLSSILKPTLVVDFSVAVLKELVNTLVTTKGVAETQIMLNLSLVGSAPPDAKLDAFLAQHQELEYLFKMDCLPNDGGNVGKSERTAPSEVVTPVSRVYLHFQHNLQKYLEHADKLSTDDVCCWILKQYVGEVNPAFIRALVNAVLESSIEGLGKDSKLNNSILKRWAEVLRRFIDNIADRELQLLYAVQTLVTQRQHPTGLIQGIFEILYDSNVVSEEGFESWVCSDDPLEREGKAVCLKMITSFLTWLKEADPDSD